MVPKRDDAHEWVEKVNGMLMRTRGTSRQDKCAPKESKPSKNTAVIRPVLDKQSAKKERWVVPFKRNGGSKGGVGKKFRRRKETQRGQNQIPTDSLVKIWRRMARRRRDGSIQEESGL